LALAAGGFRVTVVDARPAPDRAEAGFDGRAYALAIASVRLLKAIGVWGAVADKAQPILEIKASDGRAGEGAAPFFLHFDAAEIEEGPMGHMLEDRFLYAAFLAAMQDTNGFEKSDLMRTTWDDQGFLVGHFTNDNSRKLYQVPLANFISPNSLHMKSGMLFEQTAESGAPTVQGVGASERAVFAPAAIEQSNVDVAQEFSRMIMTQAAYNASSVSFRTVDEMTMTARDLAKVGELAALYAGRHGSQAAVPRPEERAAWAELRRRLAMVPVR
jgi:hypothetical protein